MSRVVSSETPLAASPPGAGRDQGPFASILIEAVAAIAAGQPAEHVVATVLERLRAVLQADSCVLLTAADRGGPAAAGGVVAGWGAPAEPREGHPCAEVRYRGEVVATLQVLLTRPLSGDEREWLQTAANLLACVLGPADARSRRHHADDSSAAADPRSELVGKTLDSLPLGLYVIDRQYRIQVWNRKRETGTQGVSRAEALGRSIFEILHRQPVATLRREFEEAFTTGRIQRIEVDSYALGALRTYRISKIPMRLHEGEVTHVITIGEDITEWKRTQERVAQASKLAAVGQLAAGVMHEINNPLATIGVCAEGVAMRLEAQDLEPQTRAAVDDYLQIVRSEVDRCKRIIERLLDFTRPRPLSKAPVDLNVVVEKTLHLVKHHERFRKAVVDRDLDREHPVWVYGNEEALVQVFMALLLNAADAVQGRGRIAVRTRVQETGGMVVGEVADDGCGIPRSDLARIFDPFFTTKEPGRGTGLGLSICYGLVADHAGRIEVESTTGAGSSFRVLLPSIRPPTG